MAQMHWDTAIPQSADDVIALLRRRIEVHLAWRDALAAESPRHLTASEHGAGTIESHQRYADQYDAAISQIERVSAALDYAVRAFDALADQAHYLRPYPGGPVKELSLAVHIGSPAASIADCRRIRDRERVAKRRHGLEGWHNATDDPEAKA